MALLICKECGNTFSSTAKACPHCGARVKSKVSLGRVVLVVLVILISAVYYVVKREYAPGTVVQTDKKAEEKKQDEAVQRAMAGARILKKAMLDREDFLLDRALVISGTGTVCYQYRTSNAQGVIVRGQAVLSGDDTSLYTNEMHGFSRLWNMECAGKSGTEALTAIRRFAP